MILTPNLPISKEIQDDLSKWHEKVLNAGGFTAQVAEAERLFRMVSAYASFQKLRKVLYQMSCTAERCHYCEDSKGNQVEHFKPKAWFPLLCFIWDN